MESTESAVLVLSAFHFAAVLFVTVGAFVLYVVRDRVADQIIERLILSIIGFILSVLFGVFFKGEIPVFGGAALIVIAGCLTNGWVILEIARDLTEEKPSKPYRRKRISV